MYQLSGRPSVALNPEQLIRRILRGPAYPSSDYFPTIRRVTARPIDYGNETYESRMPVSLMGSEDAYSQKQEADQVFLRTPDPVEHASQSFVPESRITEDYNPEVDRIFIDMAIDELFGQEPSAADSWTDDTESADPVMADALDNARTDASSGSPDLEELIIDDTQSNSPETEIDDVLDDSSALDTSLDTIIDELMGVSMNDEQPEDAPLEAMDLAPY